MTQSSVRSPAQAFASQQDEALRLLAMLYHRWFLVCCSASYRAGMDNPRGELFARLRTLMVEAASHQNAIDRLNALLLEYEAAPDEHALTLQARDLVQQVQTAGSVTPLVAGETDGFRHLCLRCSQHTAPEQCVRFFYVRDRRPLLKPEISGALRSDYARCQLCQQALNPVQVVRFVPAGTCKHASACNCGSCNRASIASLLNLYACDWSTQAIQLPYLAQVAAPSRQQCVERAVRLCWRSGWYILNQEVLPSPPALVSPALVATQV